MENIIIWEDALDGLEYVNIINEDGSISGMTKKRYDEIIAQQEAQSL